MSTLNAELMTHAAVYWGGPADNADGGKTFDGAVSLSVFWADARELFRDGQGEKRISKAQVFVQQALEEGGFLWKGALASLSAVQKAHPATVEDAFQVRKFDSYTGFDGSDVRLAWL
jgi:hypothetical protein